MASAGRDRVGTRPARPARHPLRPASRPGSVAGGAVQRPPKAEPDPSEAGDSIARGGAAAPLSPTLAKPASDHGFVVLSCCLAKAETVRRPVSRQRRLPDDAGHLSRAATALLRSRGRASARGCEPLCYLEHRFDRGKLADDRRDEAALGTRRRRSNAPRVLSGAEYLSPSTPSGVLVRRPRQTARRRTPADSSCSSRAPNSAPCAYQALPSQSFR